MSSKIFLHNTMTTMPILILMLLFL